MYLSFYFLNNQLPVNDFLSSACRTSLVENILERDEIKIML